jgi:hypothetical protein
VDDTSIKISKAARERLSTLAAERGTTMRELVERMAGDLPTESELAERAERARTYLSEHMGIEVTDDALAASAALRTVIAGRSAA